MDWIMGVIRAYPVMSVVFIGSLIGTILAYAVPDFTLDHLCAHGYFQPGNLGLAVFVHNGWGHLIQNMILTLPISMLCQRMYGISAVFILLIIYSLSTCLLHIPFHKCSCGFSGCMNMMLAMVCVYGHHKFGYFILILYVVISCAFEHYEGNYANWIHCSGTVFGIISGLLLQVKK